MDPRSTFYFTRSPPTDIHYPSRRYSFSFSSPVSAQSLKVQLHVHDGDIVIKKQKAITITWKQQSDDGECIQKVQIMYMPFGGTIHQKDANMKCKKNTIKLFQLERCMHKVIPQTEKETVASQLTKNQPMQNIGNLPLCCSQCGQTIDSYFPWQEQCESTSDYQKKLHAVKMNFCQCTSLFSKTHFFTANTPVAVLPVVCQLMFPHAGFITEFNLSLKDGIMYKYTPLACIHKYQSKELQDKCCKKCLFQAFGLEGVNRLGFLRKYIDEKDAIIFYFGVNHQKKEKEYIQYMQKQRKGILVLDIDQTVINCAKGNQNQIIKSQFSSNKQIIFTPQRQIVIFRPFTQYLLNSISDKFQIYIYSKGLRDYCERICSIIRHKLSLAEDGLNPNLIISREEDYLSYKSLSNILPKMTHYILVLDDNKRIWKHHHDNVIKAVPFQVFMIKENKFFASSQQQVVRALNKAGNDCFLVFAVEKLIQIHSLYFKKGKTTTTTTFAQYNTAIKQKLLKSFPKIKITAKSEEESQLLSTEARSFGLKIAQNPQQACIHLFHGDLLKSNMLKSSIKEIKANLKLNTIIHLDWITTCQQYFYAFNYERFALNEDNISNADLFKSQKMAYIAQIAEQLMQKRINGDKPQEDVIEQVSVEKKIEPPSNIDER